jgi:hypothetical protein
MASNKNRYRTSDDVSAEFAAAFDSFHWTAVVFAPKAPQTSYKRTRDYHLRNAVLRMRVIREPGG